MTFLLSEDKAMRENLQGIVVHDQKADGSDTPRPVGVWFGQPDQELRTQSYPYITIDMIDVQKDSQREMRGVGPKPAYMSDPAGFNSETQGLEMELPIPVNIDYQITAYSRHPRHDREIISQLLYQKLPFRFGYLALDDGTLRRMDVLDMSKRDVTEQAKRLFVNTVSVRVSSEIAQGQLKTLYKVLQVNVDPPATNPVTGRPGHPNYVGIGSFTNP